MDVGVGGVSGRWCRGGGVVGVGVLEEALY